MYVYYYLFYCYLFKFTTCPTSPFAFNGDSVHLQGAKVIILRYFSKYNLKKYAFLPRFLTVLLFFATFCCKLWAYFAHFVNCRFLFKETQPCRHSRIILSEIILKKPSKPSLILWNASVQRAEGSECIRKMTDEPSLRSEISVLVTSWCDVGKFVPRNVLQGETSCF